MKQLITKVNNKRLWQNQRHLKHNSSTKNGYEDEEQSKGYFTQGLTKNSKAGKSTELLSSAKKHKKIKSIIKVKKSMNDTFDTRNNKDPVGDKK